MLFRSIIKSGYALIEDKLYICDRDFLEDTRHLALIPREERSHKGTFGSVGIVVGPNAMMGASMLAAKAAYRCGCGLVKVFCPNKYVGYFNVAIPETVVVPYKNDDISGAMTEFAKSVDVVLVGPGLKEDSMKEGFQSMDLLVTQLIDRVQEMADNPNDITGVPTGFIDLDRMTAGLQVGDLVVLAARPSMGKTAFAINIAEHVALEAGLPVAVFSMEMGAAQLVVRIVGSIGRIDQSHLRTGRLTDEEWPRLTEAIERLRTVSLHIDETPGLTPSELRASARRLARQQGKLGLIVVDYLQLMTGSVSEGENRATELGKISRGLKALAKELQCPVLALSQLNRSVEQRTDKRPMMSDLRESGAIEQDADIIMFIYRDDYYNKEKSAEPGVAEIIIGKQRNGPDLCSQFCYLGRLGGFLAVLVGGVLLLVSCDPVGHEGYQVLNGIRAVLARQIVRLVSGISVCVKDFHSGVRVLRKEPKFPDEESLLDPLIGHDGLNCCGTDILSFADYEIGRASCRERV